MLHIGAQKRTNTAIAYGPVSNLYLCRKGIRATIVLFFFLGMSSLLFCINPRDSGIYEDAYMVTNAVLKGSQV